jgi:hypothetical protein
MKQELLDAIKFGKVYFALPLRVEWFKTESMEPCIICGGRWETHYSHCCTRDEWNAFLESEEYYQYYGN